MRGLNQLNKEYDNKLSLGEEIDNLAGCNVSGRITFIERLVKEKKNAFALRELKTLKFFVGGLDG